MQTYPWIYGPNAKTPHTKPPRSIKAEPTPIQTVMNKRTHLSKMHAKKTIKATILYKHAHPTPYYFQNIGGTQCKEHQTKAMSYI